MVKDASIISIKGLPNILRLEVSLVAIDNTNQ